MRQYFIHFFLFILLLSAGCKHTEVRPSVPLPLEEQQMALGNPSLATPDPSNYNNYLMMKPQYALSYSRDRGTANWVSWHINKDWIGDAPRQNNFRVEMTLPDGWYRVTPSSYTGSGFDRGHNVPSADRTRTEADNSATFLMINMIPQAPKNNQETWGNLEDYTRRLVEEGYEIYVIMGNYGIGGTGTNGQAEFIDHGRVTVPARIWKVLLILPEGENDLNRISTSTRVIAIDTSNNNTLSSNWGTFRTTVDAIEKETGYDLLSNVPTDIQKIIEGHTDNGPTR